MTALVSAEPPQVLEEIQAGDGIGLSAVRRTLGVDLSTSFRWVVTGILRNGRRLKLEAVKIGGRWRTSRAAVNRFIQQQQQTAGNAANAPRSPAAHDRAAREAGELLERLGA